MEYMILLVANGVHVLSIATMSCMLYGIHEYRLVGTCRGAAGVSSYYTNTA